MARDNLDTAKRYLAAIANNVSGDELATFFGPGMEITEMPNRIYPKGQKRDVPAMLEGLERVPTAVAAATHRCLPTTFSCRSACATRVSAGAPISWSGCAR